MLTTIVLYCFFFFSLYCSGQDSFKAAYNENSFGNTKCGNSIYFLEGNANFIDVETEWAYDKDTRVLSVQPPAGRSPVDIAFRHKVTTYAMNITNAPNVVVANVTFFGATFQAASNISHLRFESVQLLHPSYPKRMLGSIVPASPTVLSEVALDTAATGSTTATERPTVTTRSRGTSRGRGKPTAAGSSFSVHNCTWYGADGPVFHYFGTSSTMTNNLFKDNNWSGADEGTEHTGMGSVLLSVDCGGDDVFTRNTFDGNGPSVGYASGIRSTVRFNYCTAEADIDNDGACIQIRSSSANNTVLEMNWVWKSVKGYRLDSGSNSAFSPGEINNTISKNVAMFSKGFELKNDYNKYLNNLALFGVLPGAVRTGASGAPVVFRIDADRFATENSHSIVAGNVASSWTVPLRGVVPKTNPNVYDNSTIGQQLRDPWNRDFRPVKGSAIAVLNAGPYSYAETMADIGIYWIPGRLLWKPSMPTPPDQSTTASPILDLMFLQSHMEGVGHIVLLGKSPDTLKQVGGIMPPGVNVKSIASAATLPLPAGSAWCWRVDVIDYDSKEVLVTGDAWTFVVRTSPPVPPPPTPPAPPTPPTPPTPPPSPSPPPSPPPPPPPPPSPSPSPPHPPPSVTCTAALQKACPNSKGKENACETCVIKNQKILKQARCWAKGARSRFLKAWCD